MTVIVLSLLIGVIAGLRAMTAPAAAAFGARIGAIFALLSILPKRMGELKSGKPNAD